MIVIRYGYVGCIILLAPMLSYYKIDFYNIIEKAMIILSVLIIIIVFLDFIGWMPLEGKSLAMWLHYSGNAMIGRQPSHVLGFVCFLKASPMLVLLIPEEIKRHNWIIAGLFIVALFLSGTRANIFMSFISVILALIYSRKNVNNRIVMCLFVLLIVLLIVLRYPVIELIKNIFENKGDSDSVRYNELASILAMWRDNPLRLIFGAGYTGKFYCTGVNVYLYNIELSYWNLLRQVGIIPFILYIYLFFKPLGLFKYYKYRMIAIGYVLYLVIAYTNPLLFSSTGMIALLFETNVMFNCINHNREYGEIDDKMILDNNQSAVI